jgi:hypothetical protein
MGINHAKKSQTKTALLPQMMLDEMLRAKIGANVTPCPTRPSAYELTDDDDDPGPSAA